MRDELVRWRYLVACEVVLAVVLSAGTLDAASAKAAGGDRRPQIAAAERGPGDRVLPRIVRWIVKAFSDELIGPRP